MFSLGLQKSLNKMCCRLYDRGSDFGFRKKKKRNDQIIPIPKVRHAFLTFTWFLLNKNVNEGVGGWLCSYLFYAYNKKANELDLSVFDLQVHW